MVRPRAVLRRGLRPAGRGAVRREDPRRRLHDGREDAGPRRRPFGRHREPGVLLPRSRGPEGRRFGEGGRRRLGTEAARKGPRDEGREGREGGRPRRLRGRGRGDPPEDPGDGGPRGPAGRGGRGERAARRAGGRRRDDHHEGPFGGDPVIRPKKLPYAGTEKDPEATISDINRMLRDVGITSYQWTTLWESGRVELLLAVEEEGGKVTPL